MLKKTLLLTIILITAFTIQNNLTKSGTEAAPLTSAVTKWNNNYGYDAEAGSWRTDKHIRFLADVNGDGKQDIVGFGSRGVYVAVSNGTAFTSFSKWSSDFSYEDNWRIENHVRLLADINGDGKDDIVGFGNNGVMIALSTGSSFGTPTLVIDDFGYDEEAGGWRNEYHIRTTADVNGDGKADVIGFGHKGVYVAISNGSSFQAVSKWSDSFDVEGGWNIVDHQRMMADFNNDGKDDVVGFFNDGVYVSLSTGSSFSNPQNWLNNFGYDDGWRSDKHIRTTADINGDNKADIIGFGNNGVYVAISSGSSFTNFKLWSDYYGYDTSAGGWRIEYHPRYIGDINGDGKDDIVGFSGSGVYTSTSTGSAFTTENLYIKDYGYYAGGWRVETHPRILGDVNDDGKMEIVGFGNKGVFVSTNIINLPPIESSCDFFYSQKDTRWYSHPLRTTGECSTSCNTIGSCGCTLTSAAMLFTYYGADLNPAELSDCMLRSACPFNFYKGASCTNGKATFSYLTSFSWSRLENEINNNHRPVIIEMRRYDGAKPSTHWVLVVSGEGSSAANYLIYDPAYINGENMKLSVYSRNYYFNRMAVYKGVSACDLYRSDGNISSPNIIPEKVIMDGNGITEEDETSTATRDVKIVIGSVEIFRLEDDYFTAQLLATSEETIITDMLIWTDILANSTWQPFSSLVNVDIADYIYVQFRDENNNISDVYSAKVFAGADEDVGGDGSISIFHPLIIE